MHGIGLLQGVKVLPVASGAAVDTAGFEGVMFITEFAAANTSNALSGEHGDLANGSDLAATTGAVDMDATATVGVLQMHKPLKRYVACTATGTTNSIIAVLYGPRNSAVTQTSAVNATAAISPATA